MRPSSCQRIRTIATFAAGVFSVALLLLAAGEAFLRTFPPSDFRPYLGEESGRDGPFRTDERFGVQYHGWEAFADDYAPQLAELRPLLDAPSTPGLWAMFGNSFVQAPGMLADTTRAVLPQRPVFSLARNEPLFVRAAQVELLLEHGLKPERIFFVLLPHDVGVFGQHTLSQIHATSTGGLAYHPRKPGGVPGAVLDHSRLALLAWVRAEMHYAVPRFQFHSLSQDVHPIIRADLRQTIRHLADAGRRHGVPLTVVLIPNHEQITRGARFSVQDDLTPICHEAGLDVCDVRAPFLAAGDKPGLFLPDKHFSERGNRLLLDAIRAHLESGGQLVRGDAP